MFGLHNPDAYLPDAVRLRRQINALDAQIAANMQAFAVPGRTLLKATGDNELVIMTDYAGRWCACVVEDGVYTASRLLPVDAVHARLSVAQIVAGHATFKVPPGLTGADVIDDWMRLYQHTFGHGPDGGWTADADTPPSRSCYADGHVWVDTGTLSTGCKFCDAKAVWNRETASWVEVRA